MGAAVAVHGVKLGLRAGDERTLDAALARLPPGTEPVRARYVQRLYSVIAGDDGKTRGTRRLSILYRDDYRLARDRSFDQVLEWLEDDAQRFVAEEARDRLFVHAAVVGWQGKAIVIPGSSGSGKTTLAAELVRAGAEYLSDEYALFDRRGRVHPYPRPLAFRHEDGASWRRMTAEELGGARGGGPLPVGLVLLTEYRAGAEWSPETLSPANGVLGLLAHTVRARRDPAEAIAVLTRVAERAVVLRGPRGEARATARRALKFPSYGADRERQR